MIKSLVATTREIDDAELAVKEILSQLNVEKNLLKYSLGIVACFSEFHETGVLKAICDALPFDCIGATTCVCSLNQEADQLLFAITVLTSDDCEFKTVSLDLSHNYEKSIANGLDAFLKQKNEKPALLLSYFPLINAISGDMILNAIDKVTGEIPLFGTTAVDHTMDYGTSMTISNGVALREHVVLGAIYGSPKVTYEIAALDESKIRSQRAIITESEGNLLIGVNGKSAVAYLEEIGLTKQELSTGLGIIPLVVDHKDGTKPVARAVFGLTPDGHAICGGAMPVDATLGLGRVDRKDVLMTTSSGLVNILKEEGIVLSYSCMARYLALGAHNTAEAEIVAKIANEKHCMFACSGGEICPLPDANGKLRNFYHNYTIVFCRLS